MSSESMPLSTKDQIEIGFLLYPEVTQLDATGPAEVLGAMANARVHMLWKERVPVRAEVGFELLPTTAFADCPDLDVICVPGGAGLFALMDDAEVLDFLRRQGAQASYVTSVCTGALLLGAAGLLRGYRSACHWAFREQLAQYGAEVVAERVVRDRNRMSGGGVTAGIDFALTLVAEICGAEQAQIIQLGLEYDPAPPFDSGSPERATPEAVATIRSLFRPERYARANATP
ncbi:MAG: DJ-1/PfpI family protein [Pseudomonadota bacterium]